MSNRNSALSNSKSSNTYFSYIKGIIANMPDNLDTKKDIDEYYRDAIKKVHEKLKEETKETKTTAKVAPAEKRGRKKEKEKEVDEEGNEIEIPVSNYTTFTNGHRPKVKAVISGLSPQNLFKEVAKLWKIYKEFVIENKNVGDEKLAELWELHLEKLLEKIKKEKEKEVDEEGNEIEIPVSNYTTFTNGHRPKVKAVISGLSPQNLFKEVAKLWKIYKEFVIENKNVGDEKLAELWELHLEKLLEKIKEETKETKTTAKVAPAEKRERKKGKEKGVDEEGNEIEVVKKPVSIYMKFIEGHRHRIKAVNSGLSPQDLFKVVAELWEIYKKFVIENKNVGDEKLAELWELHLEKLLEKGSTHLRK